MTLFYQTQSWSSQPQISEETINLWKHLEGAEQAIDASITHYEKKLGYLRGPQVVKTFE